MNSVDKDTEAVFACILVLPEEIFCVSLYNQFTVTLREHLPQNSDYRNSDAIYD